MPRDDGQGHIPVLEWVTAAASLVVVLGLLAFLLTSDVAPEGAVPALDARLVRVVHLPSADVAEIIVRNESPVPAAAVEIEGEAGGEVSHATIDYVPGYAERRIGLQFAQKAGVTPTIRVTGYAEP